MPLAKPVMRATWVVSWLANHEMLKKVTLLEVSAISIHPTIIKTAKRETSKPERGILSFRREVINQRGETVVEGVWKLLVRRAPKRA